MRILIAEDDPLLREGLALLLAEEGHEIIGPFSNATTLAEAIDSESADVAVIDVRMPPSYTDEGIVAAVEVRTKLVGFPVLVLSAHVERAFATDLLATGTRGLGYLLKDRVGRVEEFINALDRVAEGGTAFDPEVVAQLLSRAAPERLLNRLSAKETEVLALMAEGLDNATISARLFVTESAIHKHIRNIFAKLDLAVGDGHDRRVAAVLRFLDR